MASAIEKVETNDTNDYPDSEEPPKHHVRWFHGGPPMLLSSAPVTLGPTPVWQPFTREESDACEESWQALSEDEKITPLGFADDTTDEDHDDTKVGIPVSRDKLFEVDVISMKLSPVFWKSTVKIPVIRGQWMYDESSYEVELRTALEIGAQGLEKLKTPLVLASSEPNTTGKQDTFVIFEDAAVARVITGPIRKSLVSTLFTLTSRGKSQAAHPSQLGGTVYYRGSDEAEVRIKAAKQTRPQSPTGSIRSRSPSLTPALRSRKALADELEEQREAKRARVASPPPNLPEDSTISGSAPSSGRVTPHGREIAEGRIIPPVPKSILQPVAAAFNLKDTRPTDNNDAVPSIPDAIADIKAVDEMKSVTDLILVVHGIGQGLTATYEAFDFVYATNMFRDVARTQAQTPAIGSIMRDRRVQFLPVQWRASLKLDLGEELAKQKEGLDNHFNLEDITLKNTIPYESQAKTSIRHSPDPVCEQSPPGKDDRVRVHFSHIVAHSLGSALVAHILSNQPTVQVPLSQLSAEAKETKTQFIFDTSNLFLIGSPLGVFVHLNQAQLIARRGRERTNDSPPDEALDRVGIFGCMAVDAVYNIFNPADPVVYLLNPCVDAERAKVLPATAIPNVTEGYLSNFSGLMSKMLNNIPIPTFFGSGGASGGGTGSSTPRKSGVGDRDDTGMGGDVIMELADEGPPEGLKGTQAERRFLALNPHGTLDYYLPSGTGNISEYVDMITAHSAYWSDESLAAFVLAETFATSADYLRTDVGVANTVHRTP
ncbi:hypothetical protein FRC04_001756 [Tulasnella sp. 424]|nr:hypothetical protein FRC04_001756 [Tulasnella sp. 424]